RATFVKCQIFSSKACSKCAQAKATVPKANRCGSNSGAICMPSFFALSSFGSDMKKPSRTEADDQFSKRETEQRMKAALLGARIAGPKHKPSSPEKKSKVS